MNRLRAKISFRRTLRLVKPNIDHSSTEDILLDVYEKSTILINSTKPILSRTNYYLVVEEILEDQVKIKIKEFSLVSEWPEDADKASSFEPVEGIIKVGQSFKWHKPGFGTSDDWEFRVFEINSI